MLRRRILGILHFSGFLRLWRFLHKKHLVILTLHGVMDDTDRTSKWIPLRPQLPPWRLDLFLKVISKRYTFVSLQEAVDMLAGRKPLRPYCVVVTFDDGYRNNIKHALPILRRHRAPATFFIATGHVEDRRPFWFDRVDYAVQHVPLDGRSVQFGRETIRCGVMSRGELADLYKKVRWEAKAVVRDDHEMRAEMDAIAEKLESEGGGKLSDIFEDDDWTAVLTWEEITAALKDDVCFGSHTVDHVRLGLVDRDSIRDQLRGSKEMIERNTERECVFLCYPSGSHSAEAAQIARECGYAAALTTIEGTNRVGEDLMSLKRINFPNDGSVAEMLTTISGLSTWISRKESYFRLRRAPKHAPAGAGLGTAT